MTRHTHITAGQYAEALERAIKRDMLPLIPKTILADIIVALEAKRREAVKAEREALDKICHAVVEIFNERAESQKAGGNHE
jgi:hypothetical protein